MFLLVVEENFFLYFSYLIFMRVKLTTSINSLIKIDTGISLVHGKFEYSEKNHILNHLEAICMYYHDLYYYLLVTTYI